MEFLMVHLVEKEKRMLLWEKVVRGRSLSGSHRREEDVVMGEGVAVTSSSLEMLTISCLCEIMVSLIFLEGLEEEA
nr:hypothetical protein [Tanacetum cinerariifolium]